METRQTEREGLGMLGRWRFCLWDMARSALNVPDLGLLLLSDGPRGGEDLHSTASRE